MLMILSRSLPDLNIVTNEEVDDAYTDDSDDCCALGTKQPSIPWGSRRRIVEFEVLANKLASCENCTNSFQLSHVTSIGPYGLAAILKVS